MYFLALCDSMMKTLEKYQKYSYGALESNQPVNDSQVFYCG